MVAAFSSADMIVEFLQLPISNYRNISVEGNRANWPAATVPATSQISSPGFHIPGAELQRGGYDMVVRHWRNSPAMIFLFVKTFHLVIRSASAGGCSFYWRSSSAVILLNRFAAAAQAVPHPTAGTAFIRATQLCRYLA